MRAGTRSWTWVDGLEDGHGLGEVARFVGIPAEQDGDAPREVLEGEDGLERSPRLSRSRENRKRVIGPAADADDPPPPRREPGGRPRQTRGDTALEHQDRRPLLDERDRP